MDKIKCPLCNNWNEARTDENNYHQTKCSCSAVLTWNADAVWDYRITRQEQKDKDYASDCKQEAELAQGG